MFLCHFAIICLNCFALVKMEIITLKTKNNLFSICHSNAINQLSSPSYYIVVASLLSSQGL